MSAVLTVRQKEVLELIIENSAISIANAITLMGINRSAVQKHYDKLKEKGVIQRMEGKSGGAGKSTKSNLVNGVVYLIA